MGRFQKGNCISFLNFDMSGFAQETKIKFNNFWILFKLISSLSKSYLEAGFWKIGEVFKNTPLWAVDQSFWNWGRREGRSLRAHTTCFITTWG